MGNVENEVEGGEKKRKPKGMKSCTFILKGTWKTPENTEKKDAALLIHYSVIYLFLSWAKLHI